MLHLMMRKKLAKYFCKILIFGFSIFHFKKNAQDIQFSQFYANIIYLNPSFAGSAHGLREVAHQRIQWPSLEAKYIFSALSVDHYFKKIRSGLGIQVLKDC